MKIHRIWKISNKLYGVLIEPPRESISPGDFIEIQDKRFPILSIRKVMGAIKLEILGEKLPETNNYSIIKTKPASGKFTIIGSSNDWIIAGLRLKGFELVDSVEKSDIVIVTKPEIITVNESQKVIIAPSISSTWQDILRFNELLEDHGITAKYDLSKPLITSNENIVVYVPTLGLRFIYPSKFSSYELTKGENSIIIGHIESKPNAYTIIFEPNKQWFIFSTSAMLMPYDFIHENADNLEALISLLKLKFSSSKIIEKEEIMTKHDTGDIMFSFSELDPEIIFNKVVEKLSIIGGLLVDRNEIERSAVIKLPLNDVSLNLEIKVFENLLRVRISSTGKEAERIRLILRALLSDSIRELTERKSLLEEFKRNLVLLLNIQEKLITIKDMVEIDWNPYSILEELKKVCGELSLMPKYSRIANEIVNVTNSLESIIKKHNKIPEEFKNELYAKIEEWISNLKKLAGSV